MNVAVVGAGAVGTTVAHDLASEGATVTLYERGAVGAGSSGRAAGVCYDAFADRRDAEIGRRAIERFRDLSGQDGFVFEPCPYVWLAREGDDRRSEAVREGAARMDEHGLDVTLLGSDALGERFGALRTDDVAVAAVTESAGYTDPGSYVDAMAARAEREGVTIRTNVEGDVRPDPPRVLISNGANRETREYDAVVVAAGAHTPGVLADAGIPVPVKPYRVQALTAVPGSGASSAPARFESPMCFDATGGFYLRPHPEGLLAGDGTEPVEVDPAAYDRDADGWFREELREALAHRLGRDVELRRAWTGLCTATPDRDPLVGLVADGLYVATGWQGHGFMRAPAIGERVAEQVLGADGVPGFDPGRFDGDEEFEIREGMAIEG